MVGKTNVAGANVYAAIGVTYPAGSTLTCTTPNIIDASGALVSAVGISRTDAITSLVANIEPVQGGAGWPSPDNIRPISGWTGAKIFRGGKNLVPQMFVGMIASANGNLQAGAANYASSDYIMVKPGESYTFSQASFVKPTSGGSHGVAFYDKDKNFLNYVTLQGGNSALGLPKTFTAPENAVYARFRIFHEKVISAPPTDVMCELGTEATEYEPYKGEIVSADWTDKAGTVYGGTLDVLSGLLTVDWAKRSFDGSEAWAKYDLSTTNLYYLDSAFNAQPGSVESLCSHAPWTTNIDAADIAQRFVVDSEGNRWYFAYRPAATLGEFTQFLSAQAAAGTPVELVYKTKNPIVYQLTAQEVSTLLGINNIWADTGDVSVSYIANGERTWTAKNTSGQWVFALPGPGAYVITATNGTNSKSQSLSISAEGQFVSMNLSYQLYLFKEGEGVAEDYTLSPLLTSASNYEITDSYFAAKGYQSGNSWHFAPKVDISNYSKLNIEASMTSRYDSSRLVKIGVSDNILKNSISDLADWDAVAVLPYNNDGNRYSVSLELSRITGEKYVQLYGNGIEYKVYNFWLE